MNLSIRQHAQQTDERLWCCSPRDYFEPLSLARTTTRTVKYTTTDTFGYDQRLCIAMCIASWDSHCPVNPSVVNITRRDRLWSRGLASSAASQLETTCWMRSFVSCHCSSSSRQLLRQEWSDVQDLQRKYFTVSSVRPVWKCTLAWLISQQNNRRSCIENINFSALKRRTDRGRPVLL